jgi:nucleoside-diphosphate-sugar epimerase
VNSYAATKYAGERLLDDYCGEKTILRPRAVFGPGDTVLFPRILVAARKGRLPLFVSDGVPVVGDVIYIDTLSDYLWKAVTLPALKPSYNVTNGEPIDIQAFLIRILNALDLPIPNKRVSVQAAMRAATCFEWTYAALRLPGEPPITQFGVSVFAYSKTFDATRTRVDFGPPSTSVEDGFAQFIAWQKAQWSSNS